MRVGLAPAPQPDERFPVVRFADGSTLTAPSFRDVATRLGLQTSASGGSYDVAIIGGGPAGLAAAVYGASEGLRTVLVERDAPGGQAGTSSRIENYLGFPTGVSGDELGTRALQQARRFGVEILVARRATSLSSRPDGSHVLVLDDGERIPVRTIVIATGVAWRELEIPGAEALVGRGVYYGAARTEALATRGSDVFLIGGGNSAGQAAMFFADYARSVTLLVRGVSLAASMSHYLIEQLATKANVSVRTRCQVTQVDGGDHLDAIVVEDRDTGERRRHATDALFVFIGADAETEWLPAEIIRDARGYICTGRDVLDLVAEARSLVARARSPPARDERARHLCRRRRAPRLDQARCLGRGRRQHVDRLRPPVSRRREDGSQRTDADTARAGGARGRTVPRAGTAYFLMNAGVSAACFFCCLSTFFSLAVCCGVFLLSFGGWWDTWRSCRPAATAGSAPL